MKTADYTYNNLCFLYLGYSLFYPEKREYETNTLYGLIVTGATNIFLKTLINRSRPDGHYTRYNSSFPSAHSTIAFYTATMLFYDNKLYGSIGYIWATSVGISRIYFNRHWPTDVLSGALLGIISGVITYSIISINENR